MITDRELMQQIADDQKLIIAMFSDLMSALADDVPEEERPITDMDGNHYQPTAGDATL